jgi:hypothetical protein
MSARTRRVSLLVAFAGAVAALATVAAVHRTSGTLAKCTARQLRFSGHLGGATQSLLGTLTLTNQNARVCALPAAPRRVSLIIGRQVLPTLTVRMRGSATPPGVPTRIPPPLGQLAVGIQWRNWCGAPRGRVRASLALTIYTVAPRLPLGMVTTPPCGDAKFSSTVAVSRFLRR